MSRRHCVPLSVLAGLCLAVPALGGTIRGSIRVPASDATPAPTMNAYPGRAGAMAGIHGPARGRVTDAVVYVASAPAVSDSARTAVPERPRLAQKDEAFMPRVVPVSVGTRVDFPNLDPIYHNVFSLSPTKRFDLGKYPRGQSKAVLFNRTGLVKVYCEIHSEMEAFVLVLPHRWFAQPGADGAFALPELPPGHYELHVWHPDLPEIVRPVDVPPRGDARVDLSFGP